MILRHFAGEEAALAEVEIEAAQAAVPAARAPEHFQTSTHEPHQHPNPSIQVLVNIGNTCAHEPKYHVAASRQWSNYGKTAIRLI